ncbi:hypothetical protein Hdeb2414_s0026g00678821 [Helianthus debilis subsp. tardiflorus]
MSVVICLFIISLSLLIYSLKLSLSSCLIKMNFHLQHFHLMKSFSFSSSKVV